MPPGPLPRSTHLPYFRGSRRKATARGQTPVAPAHQRTFSAINPPAAARSTGWEKK
jgi:hypothetical protein